MTPQTPRIARDLAVLAKNVAGKDILQLFYVENPVDCQIAETIRPGGGVVREKIPLLNAGVPLACRLLNECG